MDDIAKKFELHLLEGMYYIDKYKNLRKRALRIYPDFEKIAENPSLHISPDMVRIIIRHPKSIQILYYLGKHKMIAKRISLLTSSKRVLEEIESLVQSKI